MIESKQYPFCSELDVVEKAVHAVASVGGQDRQIRIEVLKSLVDGHYHTRAYMLEDVTFQPSFPCEDGAFTRKPRSMSVWITWVDFPWTHTNSADSALAQALGFLGDRSAK